jgi:hypothetical protein
MPCPEPRGEAVRRREFIKVFVGTATAWPLTARAQQPRAVIGFLSSASPDAYSDRLRALRQGLKEVGYVEGSFRSNIVGQKAETIKWRALLPSWFVSRSP